MSIAIPTLIEKDIRDGKARYSTFQTGIGGQSVLKVPDNSYIVIFGYDYSPAGGGIGIYGNTSNPTNGRSVSVAGDIKPFETQQISFYTGQAFHPFIHHVQINSSAFPFSVENNDPGTPNITTSAQVFQEIDNTPIERQTYIISNRSVAITVGLLRQLDDETPGINFGPIAVTENTPNGITYGNDGNDHAVQTFLSSATGSVFTQPSVEKVDFYGTGFAPQAQADNQVYLKPELNSVTTGIGLIDPSDYINVTFGESFVEAYGTHYFLNVHYALYTNQTPEQLG